MIEIDESHKQFDNIFKDNAFDLPMQRENNDFLDNLKEVLGKYQARLNDECLDALTLNGVDKICKNLIEIIELHYSGSSSGAFKRFEELMESLEEYLVTIEKVTNDSKSKYLPSLYRTRVVNESRKYKKKEIFHVPFTLRTSVDNARYSLAGYPCLYLSTTLSLCHFESNGKSNSLKIFSRFEAEYDGSTQIVILDMSKKPEYFLTEIRNRNLNINKQLKEYYYIYPMLVASSFIKPNQTQKFVPEYIIPQFLLQWFKNKYTNQNKLCGIRYFSSKDISNSNRGFNYVFPTLFTSDDGEFCNLLLKNFKLTEPVYTNKENDSMDNLDWLEKKLLDSDVSYL